MTPLDAVPGRAGPSDTVLLARLADDDAGALDALLERHWPALYRYALRKTGSADDAADVAQEVFCRLWERRAGWRARGSVKGLVFRLARNAAVSGQRRRRAHERAARQFVALAPAPAPPAASAERAELRAMLEHAIAALPARRREVFLLRMVDGLSYDEIAAAMDTSRQTVANQLSRALATLRASLGHFLD